MRRLRLAAVAAVGLVLLLAACTGPSHADPTGKPSQQPQQQVRLYNDAHGQLVEADFCDGHGNLVRVAFQDGRASTAVTTMTSDPTCKA